jgi:hypothetical protein
MGCHPEILMLPCASPIPETPRRATWCLSLGRGVSSWEVNSVIVTDLYALPSG